MKKHQEVAFARPCAYSDDTLDSRFIRVHDGWRMKSMFTVNK